MKLVYLTSKRYPSSTADHFFVLNMAKAFTRALDKDFLFLVSGEIVPELLGTNARSSGAPRHGRSLFYFFWLPVFVISQRLNNPKSVFFSNDPKLLALLIFFKKIFRFRYKICSDWHMLWRDSRDSGIAFSSDFLVTTSENLKRLLVEKTGVAEEKIIVSRGGVDLEAFSGNSANVLRNSLGLPGGYLIGYVGFYRTMGKEKGLKTMLEALGRIPDKSLNMAFVGAKEGDIEHYGAMARELGVEDRTLFLPAVEASKVPQYEEAMDILVIPYPDEPHFRDFGFPMKVYEYMAAGRPIIYSDLPLLGEVLGDLGTSFRPGDGSDLAKKIEEVRNNPNSPAFALLSKEKVKEYTWQKRAEKIIKFVS